MGSLGLNGGISWLKNTKGTLCFICDQEIETLSHFLLYVPVFADISTHFGPIWSVRLTKATLQIVSTCRNFIMNLNQHHETLLLLGYLPLPFQ